MRSHGGPDVFFTTEFISATRVCPIIFDHANLAVLPLLFFLQNRIYWREVGTWPFMSFFRPRLFLGPYSQCLVIHAPVFIPGRYTIGLVLVLVIFIILIILTNSETRVQIFLTNQVPLAAKIPENLEPFLPAPTNPRPPPTAQGLVSDSAGQ